MSRSRDAEIKRCHVAEMSQEMDVMGRTVVRKGWTVTGEGDFTRRSILREKDGNKKKYNATEMSKQNLFNTVHRWVGRPSYTHILALLFRMAETSASILPMHTGTYTVAMISQWMKHDETTRTTSCRNTLREQTYPHFVRP